ncbi:hypothetical protein M9H77_33983 [Catharanthus roseus]|uniref:Uncharacterized protein n=1 Tax=Catharanthus roseus TaxID=4058 RepID=A0ACB9ZLR1_CATRO|nr:hypothetical protein M9H77_33983 [Catharanthus roseus]
MDLFEDCLQESVGFDGNEDSNTFEEFLEPEEYIDHGYLFTTDQKFNSKDDAQKIYNVVAKIKKNRIKGQNAAEEVLSLNAEWGYTIFYRNREESNVLSDIVVAQPISMSMIRMWPYILIMDTTYKKNK